MPNDKSSKLLDSATNQWSILLQTVEEELYAVKSRVKELEDAKRILEAKLAAGKPFTKPTQN
jgi:hypothetical protein